MSSLEKRLDDLERRVLPPGQYIIVYGPDEKDPSPEALAEFERKKAAAYAEAGENGHVIVVEYVSWPPGGEKDSEHENTTT